MGSGDLTIVSRLAKTAYATSFALEGAHRDHGVMPDPSVSATRVEAKSRQAALDFLQFGERWGALKDAALAPPLHARNAAAPSATLRNERRMIAPGMTYLFTPPNHGTSRVRVGGLARWFGGVMGYDVSITMVDPKRLFARLHGVIQDRFSVIGR